MRRVLCKTLTPNPVLNHVARQPHPQPLLRRKASQYEILRQILPQQRPPPHLPNSRPPRRNRRTHRKPHPLQHPRHQHPAPKFRVHPHRFQSRPKRPAGDRPVRASRHGQSTIRCKLSGDGAGHLRRHADIGVAHNQQLMPSRLHHQRQTKNLRIRPRRRPRQNHLHRHPGVLLPQPFH